MYYYLCPRCHFKVAQGKRICVTCGHKVSVQEDTENNTTAQAAGRTSLFAKLLGAASTPEKKSEPAQEKPALS